MTYEPFSRRPEVDPGKLEKMRDLDASFASLWTSIDAWVPPGRYCSLAKTSLEQAALWAVKGLTHDEWKDE